MSRPPLIYDAARTKVESLVRARPGIKRGELLSECMEALDCSRSVAAKALTEMREEGLIEAHGYTKSSSGYTWAGGTGSQPDDRVRRIVRAADVRIVGGIRLSPMAWSVQQMRGE